MLTKMPRIVPCNKFSHNMTSLNVERVLTVHHWNDTLFSFTTTRHSGLRFCNGQFVMLGLEIQGKPLLRAYSLASANYEDYLEFLSIKVQNGPLTSCLKNIKKDDAVLVSQKAVGTLIVDDLNPGSHLYLFSTGTGIAPFISIIKDPNTYENFEKVVLVHCVRYISDLTYASLIKDELPNNPFFGNLVSSKLIYYPIVTREPFYHQDRITELLRTGKLFHDIGLPLLNPDSDRAMICGSSDMLVDISTLLDKSGFSVSPGLGRRGDYVIERAFVTK